MLCHPAAYQGDRSETSLYKFIDSMLSKSEEEMKASKAGVFTSIADQIKEQEEQQRKAEEDARQMEEEFTSVVVEVRDDTWQQQLAGKDVVLFYYATW